MTVFSNRDSYKKNVTLKIHIQLKNFTKEFNINLLYCLKLYNFGNIHLLHWV